MGEQSKNIQHRTDVLSLNKLNILYICTRFGLLLLGGFVHPFYVVADL